MDISKFTTTILEHYLPLTRHAQPPAIRNNQDSQLPEVSWPEIALLISFTSLRPGRKSAFQVKGAKPLSDFAFCERHTVSTRSYLWLRLHASHRCLYSCPAPRFFRNIFFFFRLNIYVLAYSICFSWVELTLL